MSKKKGDTGPKRPTVLIAIALVLIITNTATIYYFTFFQPSVPLEDVPQTIGDITEDPAAVIGQVVTITGYYVIAAGFPMLVSDLNHFMQESLQANNCIVVKGDPPEDMKEFLGSRCDVKGTAEWQDEDFGILGLSFSRYTPR